MLLRINSWTHRQLRDDGCVRSYGREQQNFDKAFPQEAPRKQTQSVNGCKYNELNHKSRLTSGSEQHLQHRRENRRQLDSEPEPTDLRKCLAFAI